MYWVLNEPEWILKAPARSNGEKYSWIIFANELSQAIKKRNVVPNFTKVVLSMSIPICIST